MIGLLLFITVLSDNPVIQQADSLFDAESYSTAESLYLHALTIVDHPDTAWIFKGLGNIELVFGRLASAERYYEAALDIFNSYHETRGSVKVLNNLGQVHALGDDPETAFTMYQKGLSVLEHITDLTFADTVDMIALFGNAGQTLQALQRIDDAQVQYLNALDLAREANYEKGVADNLYNRAVLFQTMGEVDSALTHYKAACSVYKALSLTKSQADCLREIGNIYRHIGDYTVSIQYLKDALDIFQSYSDQAGDILIGHAEIYNDLGLVYMELGSFARALDDFLQAQSFFEHMGDIRGVAAALQNRAAVYLEYARHDSAYYDSARLVYDIAAKYAKDPAGRAALSNNMGLFYQRLAQYDMADKAFGKALELIEETDEVNRIKFLNNRGNNAFPQEDSRFGPERALEYYTNAYSYAILQSHKTWEAALLSNIGMAQHALGSSDEAVKSLLRAAHIIEEVRGRIVGQEYRSVYFEDKVVIYEELVAIMHERGDVKQAFFYAERAKARAFLDLLSSVDLSARHDISPDIRDLIMQEQALERKVEYLTGQPGQNQAIKELGAVLDQLKQVYPEYYELKTIEPVTVAEVQSGLDNTTALIEYFVGQRNAYVFAITDHRITMHALAIRPDEVYEIVDSLVRTIRRRQDHTGYGAQLFDWLIRPVQSSLSGIQRLCVVPHGVLHHLPFSTLVIDNGELLIERYDIFYAPSASIYTLVHGNNQLHKQGAIIFAKSDFSDHYEWKDLPLPGTKAEKDSILASQALSGVRVYADSEGPAFQPSESNVKTVSPDFDIIHCATHGKLDSDQPMDSRIVFSADNEEDGNLTVREIFNMDLTAYLVTLSACETGQLKAFNERTRYSAGDDVTGLTRAFLYAGASSVVASLWKVHDLSTALMMTRFYRNLKTTDKVHALCEAQRWLAQNGELYYFNHPFFWAPFVVFGDWQ
ncbi:CHAT domain-containing protein [candidate division WOR-3 bacterium]|nr:CHAT domain-containing protein [candidate division WOR-3 bacterium]